MHISKILIYPLAVAVLVSPLLVQASEGQPETVTIQTEQPLAPEVESEQFTSDSETSVESVSSSETMSPVESETITAETSLETVMETETERLSLDKETNDLLKTYLQNTLSGNSVPSESVDSENTDFEIRAMQFFDNMEDMGKSLMLLGVLMLLCGGLLLGVTIGYGVFRRMR